MKRTKRTQVVNVPLIATVALLAAGAARSGEPFIETGVSLFGNHDKVYYRLPSLLVTSKGTVLAASQKRGGRGDDFAPSSLVLRRSLDAGKTFAPEQTLFEHGGDCTFNGNLVEDRRSGTIFACFIAFPQTEKTTWFVKKWIPKGGGFSIVKSTDDGQTWSAPIEVMPKPNAEGWHGGGAFNNNHGIQLQRGPRAGRLVICARVFKTGVYENRSKGGLIYSDDGGATWQVGGVMLKDSGAINSEVSVGETPDGEVYVNSRNEAGKAKSQAGELEKAPPGVQPQRRIFSRSRDGGESFYEEGCHSELFDGPCNAGLAWLPPDDNHKDAKGGAGGVMLFTAPAVRQRTRLTGCVSRDGGRTWKAGNIVSERSGGYSDVAVTPDRTILTLYENVGDEGRPKGLLLARYNLEWLLARK